jgi:lipopolysaccharide transport system ATP-binding protein
VTTLVAFERVSKRYTLQSGRPRSLRAALLRLDRRRSEPPDAGQLWALRDVSFTLARGETVGLIGPNGAGKSTALKLISRVIQPSSGRVLVNGRVAALLELGTGFHPDLSGRDNVFLSGALIGMARDEVRRKFDAIVDFSELAEFMDVPVKHYSSGMFARLAFAVSIHLDPEVLLVDEVLAVGDQAFQLKCLDRISQLQAQGVTICLVSHSLDSVRAVCRRALWFDHGQVRVDGAADTVVRQYLTAALAQDGQRLAAAAGPHVSQRWGSRQVEITRAWLSDAQGSERQLFETGDCLVVNLEYRVHQPVPDPVFGLAVFRQDGLHLSGPNTAFEGLRFPGLSGVGRVSYTIPYLPYLEGLYLVSVAVHAADDSATYDYHDRAYEFRVVNHSGRARERYGLISPGGTWQHCPAGEAAAQP